MDGFEKAKSIESSYYRCIHKLPSTSSIQYGDSLYLPVYKRFTWLGVLQGTQYVMPCEIQQVNGYAYIMWVNKNTLASIRKSRHKKLNYNNISL